MKIPEDPFVRELLPEFVDTWIDDIKTQMTPLIESKNPDELYRLGHTLKGSCFQFGLDDIAEMGIKVMGYSKKGEWDKAAEMEPKIIESFEKVKKFVEENS